MKLDLTTKFSGFEDEVCKDETGKDITLFSVLRTITATELKEDNQNGAQESINTKMKNFDTFIEIKNAGADCTDFEISTEEASRLKPRVAQIYSTLIAGPVLKMLDGKPPYAKPKVAELFKPPKAVVAEPSGDVK
jgi:hypothetical protein